MIQVIQLRWKKCVDARRIILKNKPHLCLHPMYFSADPSKIFSRNMTHNHFISQNQIDFILCLKGIICQYICCIRCITVSTSVYYCLKTLIMYDTIFLICRRIISLIFLFVRNTQLLVTRNRISRSSREWKTVFDYSFESTLDKSPLKVSGEDKQYLKNTLSTERKGCKQQFC